MPQSNRATFAPLSALESARQQQRPNATVGENQPSAGAKPGFQMPFIAWAGCPPDQPWPPSMSQGFQGVSSMHQNGRLRYESALAGAPGVGGNSNQSVGLPMPVPGMTYPYSYPALPPDAWQNQPSSAAQAGASYEAAWGSYWCGPPDSHGIVAQQTLRFPRIGQKSPLIQELHGSQLNSQLPPMPQPLPPMQSNWMSATHHNANPVEAFHSRRSPGLVPPPQPKSGVIRADGQVRAERIQAAVEGTAFGDGPSTPILDAVPCTAPPAVCEWLLAGGLDKLQISVLQVPGGALRNQRGVVVVSEDINFGVRAIVEEQTPASQTPHARQSTTCPLELQTISGDSHSSSVHPRGAPPGAEAPGGDFLSSPVRKQDDGAIAAAACPIVTGFLRVANWRADAILLINIRAMPRYSHCLRLKDDAGIAVQDPAKAIKRRMALAPAAMSAPSDMVSTNGIPAVLLPPGSEYVVRVVLNLSKANFASHRAERGLLAQMVLFTFVVDHRVGDSDEPQLSPGITSLPGSCVARAAAQAAGEKNKPVAADVERKSQIWKSYATVVGGRVAVAVVDKRRLMEVNSMLKATAPPFIPKALRELFTAHPSRVHSCAATIAESLFPFESVSSVLTCATVAAAPAILALRALVTALSELHPSSTSFQPRGPAAAVKGPFGPVSPVLLSAVNGPLRSMAPASGSTAVFAASDAPTLAAAVTMKWAQMEGVGRPAVQRLRALYEHLTAGPAKPIYSLNRGIPGIFPGGGGGVAGQWRMDVTQTEWGRQLATGLQLGSSIRHEAIRALQDVYERAPAAATVRADDISGISGSKVRMTYTGAIQIAAVMTAALAHQRFEFLRYGKLLVEEEDVMEHDMRTFTLYNARARVAVFSSNMATYQVLNWPPFPAQQQHHDAAASNPGMLATRRPYRGPKLQRQCAVSLEGQEQNGQSGKGRKAATVKGQAATKAKKKAAARGQEVLLAAVVEVPGLVEDRPRLVTGDLVFLRLEAQRDVEYVAQLLAVDGGQVLLVMPNEYWRDIWALSRGQQRQLADAAPAPLAHCCFSFDRTPFCRMHEALLRAALRPQMLLPPPPPPPPEASAVTEAPTATSGLPELPEDLYSYQPNWQVEMAGAASSGYTDEELAAVAAKLRLVGGTALNPEQRMACAAMLCGAGRDLPFVLFGPPGTGKTVTLVECALQILKAEDPSHAPFLPRTSGEQHSTRLLLAAPQNYSADLITSSLAAALGLQAGGGRLLRLNDPRRRVVEAKADVLPYSLVDEPTAAFRLPKPNEIQMAQIVVCSCSAAGMLREGAFVREALSSTTRKTHISSGNANNSCGIEFTHVLVDEAGQALLPEVLIPITLRAPGGAAMLCGDPRQLEPIVRSASAARNGLAISLLEILMESARREGHLDRARGVAALAERYQAGETPPSPQPPPQPLALPAPSARPALQKGNPNQDPEQRRHGREALAAAGAAAVATVSGALAPQPQSPLRGVMLVRNYRSAAPLLDLPSRLFYDQQLKACVDAKSARPPDWDLLVLPTRSAATAAAPAGPVAAGTALPPSVSTSPAAAASDPVAFDDTASAIAATDGSLEAEAGGLRLQAETFNDVTVSSDGGVESNAGMKAANPVPWKKGQQQPSAAKAAEAAEPPGVADWEGEGEIVAPSHLLFFGVRGQQHQELDAPSYFNPLEAATVAELVDSLIKASWAAATQRLEAQRQRSGGASTPGQLLSGVVSQNHIGIICTYRKQVFKMRQLLRERDLGGVRVGTVDDYQGQEERIIFISTVLSRVESLPGVSTTGRGVAGDAPAVSQSLGLWSHPRRFNVAVTRSRALLVVVGHPAVLLADKYWRELVRQCVARGTYRGAGEAQVRRRMRQQATAIVGGGSTAWWQQQQKRSSTARTSASPRAPELRKNSSGVEDTAATTAATGHGREESGGSSGGAAGDDAAVDDTQEHEFQEGAGLLDGGPQGGEDDVEYDVDLQGIDYGGEGYGEEYDINHWEDGSEADDDETDEADLADVVQQLAEMATLGMGCEDEIYPNLADLNAFYEQQSAYFEEMPFRVQL